MKKQLLKCVVGLWLVLALCTGCTLGSYYDNAGADPSASKDTTPDATGENGETPPADEDTPYTVSVYYNLRPFSPQDAQIQVVWHGDEGTVVADLDENGQASAGVLDGDYNVTLLGLPEQYSYDPNNNYVTADDRHVDILLYGLTEPKSGDGGIHADATMAMYPAGGCFVLNAEGTYRVTFTEPGQIFFFQYQPLRSGVYCVNSWCDIYEDAVNPMMDVYKGSAQYKYFDRTIDGGGASLTGGYTRNFYYEIALTDEAIGNSYTFGVKVETESAQYPLTVDFTIQRIGDCTGTSSVIELPDMTLFNRLSKPSLSESSKTYHSADMGTKLFDGSNFRYDEETYRYRVYDEEKYADNDGWGPYLVCDIMNAPACYTITSLYDANQAGGSANNFLRISIWDEAVGGYVPHYYNDFIREYYASKCDDNGRCYVTRELQEFLQLFATAHLLWTDNVSPAEGSPEDYGYSATQDDMWLFACGFYE